MSTYHHGDLRSALLASASAILEEQGIAALSIREAARRAGVSHNAPYRHFPDRDALLAALAAEGFVRLEKALDGRAGRELGEAYVRFAREHPQLFRLMFSARVQLSADAGLREQAALAFGGLQQAIASHAGKEAPFAAIAAWALVHGLSHLLLDQRLRGVEREGTEAFVHSVLGSVRFAVTPTP